MKLSLESLSSMMVPYKKHKTLNVRFNPMKAIYALANLDKVTEHMTEVRMERNKDHLVPALKYIKQYGKPEGSKIKYAVLGQWGRLQRSNKTARAYIEISRPVRHFLARDIYIDVDVANCHPAIIEQLFPLLVGKPSKALELWNEHREQIFTLMMQKNPKLNRDECKKIGFCFLYDGNLDNNFDKLELKSNGQIYDICQHIDADIALLVSRIQTLFPDVWKQIPVPTRTADKPDRIAASKFSRLMHHLERHIMLLVAGSAEGIGLEVGDYSHDGLLVTSPDGSLPSGENLEMFMHAAVAKVKAAVGIDIELKVKDMPMPPWGEGFVDSLDEPLSTTGIRNALIEECFAKLVRKDLFEIEIHRSENWKECTKELNADETMAFANKYFNLYWIKVEDMWYQINCATGRIRDADEGIIGYNFTKLKNTLMNTPFQSWACKEYDKIYFGEIPEDCNYYPMFMPNYDTCDVSDLDDEELALIQPTLHHIYDVLCKGNEDYYKYLCTFLGLKFRYPFDIERIPIVLALYGDPGSGKSTIFHYLFAEGFGLGYMGKPRNFEQLIGADFNGETEYNLVSICDEIPPMKGTRDNAWNDFKTMVTDPRRPLHKKGVTKRVIPNYVTYFMFTNYKNSIKLDEGDRRFFMLDVSNQHKNDKNYFKALIQNIKSYSSLITRYLMSFTHEVEILDDPPVTQWKEYSTKFNLDVFGQFVRDGLEEQGLRYFDQEIKKTEMAAMFRAFADASGQKYKRTNQDIYRGISDYIPLVKGGGSRQFYRLTKEEAEEVARRVHASLDFALDEPII